ncbi:MAG: dienelactone hydrolase family protein [Phenylobacterium sp.]
MSQTDVTVPTPEGGMRAFVFKPDAGAGPWPAAIIFMDAPAIRPALFEMGERLAQGGYYVLLPDLFWRAGEYAPPDLAKARSGDPEAAALFQKLRTSTSSERQMADAKTCLDFLDAEPQARAEKVGVTGYCMGGGIALRAAAAFPDRIAAAAAFHGGNMATDDPQSPHLGAAQIRAKVLVAGADEDSSFDAAQKDRLAAALEAAGVDAAVSIWPGCRHGWVPTDMPVHNPAGAHRHWRELLALFDGALKAA